MKKLGDIKMKRKEDYRSTLEELRLLEEAQALAAVKIAEAIPHAQGCKVTIERVPTHALRVKILKEGLKLNDTELDTADEIVHAALAPVRVLRYGEANQ